MKKRLLSAALALAMVLTLLPLSAMPVSAADLTKPDQPDAIASGNYIELGSSYNGDKSGAISVAWKESGAELGTTKSGTKVVTKGAGYYYYDSGNEWLYVATGGVLGGTSASGGTWYKTPYVAGTPASVMNSFTLITDLPLDASGYLPSSLNVNVNNHTLTVSTNSAMNVNLTTLTVTNTPAGGQLADKSKGVALGSACWNSVTNRSITLNVTNATVSADTIKVDNSTNSNNTSYGFSGTLKNAALTAPVYVTGTDSSSASLRLTMQGDSSAGGGVCATKAALDLDMSAGDSVGGVTCTDRKATIDVNAAYAKRATIDSIFLGDASTGAKDNKSGGTINLTSAATVTKKITAYGQTTINVKDTSVVTGGIDFLGGTATDGPNGGAPNWSGVTINVSGYQTKIGPGVNITQLPGDSLLATIKVEDTASTGGIDLSKYGGNVTVSNATTANITVGKGSLTVSNGATVDKLTMGTQGATTATISGENTTVQGEVLPTDKNTTLVINDGRFTSTSLSATNLEKGTTTVKGGTFAKSLLGSPVLSNIAYEFGWDISTTTYRPQSYTYIPSGTVNDVFQKLVDKTQAVGGVNNTQIRPASMQIGGNETYVYFELDHNTTGGSNNTPVSILRMFANENSIVDLPTQAGGRTVSNWYKGEAPHKTNYIVTEQDITNYNGATKNDAESIRKASVVLVADSTAAAGIDITAVSLNTEADGSAAYKGLTISLDDSRKVIRLSGLVTLTGNQAVIPLKLVNARGEASLTVKALVDQQNNQKRVYFTAPSNGLTISGDNSILTVNNSTQQFTLDGSGLTIRDANLAISIAGSSNGTTANIKPGASKATVNGGIAGTAGRESYKERLEAASGFDTTADSGKQLQDSIAVQQALNNVLKGITTKSQVDNYLATARRTIANELKDTNSSKYAETYAAWGTLEVEPYLDIAVTNWTNKTGTASAASLNVNLTLKYRIVAVHGNSSPWPSGMTDEQKTKLARVEVTNGNLSLSGDYGDIGVTLALPDSFAPNTTTLYAHHGNYAYETEHKTATVDSKSVPTLTFTTSHGFSPYTINETTPVAQSSKIVKNGVAVGTDYGADNITYPYLYDNLDTAVAEVADKGAIKLFPGFKTGTTNVPVSGKARIFRVITEANSQTKLNFTGSSTKFTGDEANGNMTYTVTLSSDTAVVSSNTVNVASVTGGTARVSNTKAKGGETVNITLSPSTGYTSNGVTVRTKEGAAVTVTGSGNNYSFVMPSNTDSVTVTPSFTRTNTNVTISVGSAQTGSGTATTNASNNQAAPGSVVTVTTAPASGQRTMGLSVTGATAVRTGVNTFQFTVPSGYSNVVVTPRFDINNGTVFADVWSSEYYSAPVAWAVGRGITNGTDTYTFSPGSTCNRVQMVTFLWRAAGRPSTAGMANPFNDVTPSMGSDFYNAVVWANNKGITTGDGNAYTFNPYKTVSRAEAVTFLWRYAGKPAASASNGFYDVGSKDYFAQAVTWAVNNGITNGDGSTVVFNPHGACLRAQIVTFLYRQATGARA